MDTLFAGGDVSGAVKPRRGWAKIDEGFYSSIIGICLSRSDMLTLVRSNVIDKVPAHGVTHYQEALVALVAMRMPQAGAIYAMLDVKYSENVLRYQGARTEEHLSTLWKEDLLKGGINSVSGGYWAIMTHPHAPPPLLSQISRQCQSIGFNFLSSYASYWQIIAGLRTRVKHEEKLRRAEKVRGINENKTLKSRVAILEQEVCRLHVALDQYEQLSRENCELQRILEVLKNGNEVVDIDISDLSIATQRNQDQIEGLRLVTGKGGITGGNKYTEKRARSAQAEQSVARSLLPSMYRETDRCASICEENGRGADTDLTGKTILYVGGDPAKISGCRQVVERRGGRFLLFGDSGKTMQHRLPDLVHDADAVLCPLDCINCDTCDMVFQVCIQQQKPFFVMKSSSLLSLAEGLD